MLGSSTHDQLSNVIHKIQNPYQHHHYYHNDLNFMCNRKTKQNKRHKRRKRNRNRRNTKKPKTTKYSINSKNSIIKYYNNSCNSKNIKISIKHSSKGCYCANCIECCKVNLKISYEIDSYLNNVCVYFEKNFSNLQLMLIIISLALITSCTAQSMNNQVKYQRMLTTNRKLLLASNDAAAPMATSNFSKSWRGTIFPQHNRNASLSTKDEAYIKFKTHICHHNLRHRYQRYHLKGQRHIKQLNTHKHLKNLKFHNKSFSKWLTTTKMCKKFQITNLYDQQNAMKKNINFQHGDDNDDDVNDHEHHYLNDLAEIINNPHQSYKHKNFNIKNNEIKMPKEDAVEEQQINTSNVSNIFQNIRANKYYTKINNNSKTNYIYNEMKNPIKYSKDEILITNKYKADNQDNDRDNNDEHAEIISFEMSHHYLLSTGNNSLQVNHKQQQHHLQHQKPQQEENHIDHIKLTKLVMDGLGLKKLPKIEKINISQEEYVTKYREYLQRVYMRKYRWLRDFNGDYDFEFSSKPLEILSIVSNSTLLKQFQDYKKSYYEGSHLRQKRTVLRLSNVSEERNNGDHQYDRHDEERNQSLEDRVRNILFLKKKYLKPRSTKADRDERKTNIRLMFALKPEIFNLNASDIDEANIRLVLIHSPILAIRNSKNKKTHTNTKSNLCGGSSKSDRRKDHQQQQQQQQQVNVLNLKLFFIPKHGKRILLAGRKIDIQVDYSKPDETHTQWLQFDVSKAVKMSIDDKRFHHIALELQCDNCKRIGARILNDAYNTASDALADNPHITEGRQLMPVLNIIGRFDEASQSSMRPHKYDENQQIDVNEADTTQRHYHHQTYNNNNHKNNKHNRRTNCYKAHQRCCRHSMEVTFKEIKGFEFIIQPKVFDAGYCHGRCPPRYNPAHHHALLQSLIWKQNHHKAPRPCCAPSKLVELEVLHVDEKNNEKLKISTWSDMKVVECACS